MNIEIELKYEVLDATSLKLFTKKLELLYEKNVLDVYLDTVNADLCSQGIYVRIRDNKKIDIKFNRASINDRSLPMQPDCEEYSFKLPLSIEQLAKFNEINSSIGLKTISVPDIQLYKKANNFIDHRVIDKIRKAYKSNGFTICVDDVKDLGVFLEIELMAIDNKNIDSVVIDMKKELSGLKLKPLTTGYSTLILKKNNFEQYINSRFIMDEDRKYLSEYNSKISQF